MTPRRTTGSAPAALGAMLALTILMAAAGSVHPQSPGIAFVKAGEVYRIIEQGVRRVVLVDVRSREEYATRHIRGAVSIPLAETESRASEIPREGLVVLY